MTQTYKGYQLFNDLEDDLLQAWNRAQTIANINQQKGADEALAYADHFDKVERMKIELLLMAVSTNGKEAIQKRITQCIETE